MGIKLMKKSALRMKGAAGPAKAGEFILVDNEDDTFDVMGADSVGNPVDISAVATITASSDNTSVLTVDPPTGMSSAMHAVGPLGSANVTVVATWNDGSLGPFTAALPVSVVAGPANSVVIVPGTPTVH